MFSELLSTELIIPELHASDKNGVIEEMVTLLASAGAVADGSAVKNAVMEREQLGSTGVGNNVAIPHAKCSVISSVTAMFAKSTKGVDFAAIDGKEVNYFFLLLAPTGEAGKHLKLLARISRLINSGGIRDELKEANTAQEILKIIIEAEANLP